MRFVYKASPSQYSACNINVAQWTSGQWHGITASWLRVAGDQLLLQLRVDGQQTFQSGAVLLADVPAEISDSYRLFLSLLCCAKPVVTGAFTIEAFEVMKDLQLAVRGTRGALAEKPLTIFSCCLLRPIGYPDGDRY